MIRELTPDDWKSVSGIYQEGIDTGNATFETRAPEWDAWDQSHLKICRFVFVQDALVCGWAALSEISNRCVYGGVAEVSVYVAEEFRGQNIGAKLLNHLIRESEKQNIWTIQAGVFPENIASIKLHERSGFRFVGRREKLGKHNGIWRDVYQYERRSSVAGI